MAIVKLNDIEIYYELHGKGQPLVLIAGYSCDHFFWASMLDELKQHFQVLIFDNRAIGQTKDDGKAFSLEKMTEDTIGLIQKLGIIRPHILGQSVGGTVAQLIAHRYPDQLNKLIILNSVAKFNARTLLAMKSILNLRKTNTSFDDLVNASLPWFFSSQYLADSENIKMLKTTYINNPYPQSTLDQARQNVLLSTFDSRPWSHEIKAQTCVIAAKEDIICLPAESQRLVENIQNAKFNVISGGHSSPIEQPNQVNEMVISFLK